MKKIIFIFLNLIITLTAVHAQKGINFSSMIAGGGKLLICVDSLAENIYYANVFPNQPNTFFSYLPEVNNMSIQINFRKNINVTHYRYTILVDEKPVAVNNSINKAQLIDTHAGGDEELFSSTKLGTFAISGKVITVLVYSIETPQDIEKSIFYGKPIPKAKIEAFGTRFKVEKGVDYRYITNPKEVENLNLTEKDDELTIVKDKSGIDYIYNTSIIDKQTNKTIFESTAWQYGNYVTRTHEFSPYLKFDKNVFKKSGDYEIIIQPSSFARYNMSPKELEKYTARYTISIALEEENYTKKELISSALLFSMIVGGITGGTAVYLMNRMKKRKVAAEVQRKEIAQLQLNSVRSQLNPHFLFNALAGIQNLMNRNETDNANRYLSKFARLTRNVLDSKELVSLSEEKTLLDDYLQMEQLRFGFKYEIKTATELDNVEIPSMLLQPFVENAVKHGMTDKGKEGKIDIEFVKQSGNLVLTINDNGKGFDAMENYEGLGLNLSKNRISLLNTIYKETPLVLDIQSDENGTKISITLTQWL